MRARPDNLLKKYVSSAGRAITFHYAASILSEFEGIDLDTLLSRCHYFLNTHATNLAHADYYVDKIIKHKNGFIFPALFYYDPGSKKNIALNCANKGRASEQCFAAADYIAKQNYIVESEELDEQLVEVHDCVANFSCPPEDEYELLFSGESDDEIKLKIIKLDIFKKINEVAKEYRGIFSENERFDVAIGKNKFNFGTEIPKPAYRQFINLPFNQIKKLLSIMLDKVSEISLREKWFNGGVSKEISSFMAAFAGHELIEIDGEHAKCILKSSDITTTTSSISNEPIVQIKQTIFTKIQDAVTKSKVTESKSIDKFNVTLSTNQVFEFGWGRFDDLSEFTELSLNQIEELINKMLKEIDDSRLGNSNKLNHLLVQLGELSNAIVLNKKLLSGYECQLTDEMTKLEYAQLLEKARKKYDAIVINLLRENHKDEEKLIEIKSLVLQAIEAAYQVYVDGEDKDSLQFEEKFPELKVKNNAIKSVKFSWRSFAEIENDLEILLGELENPLHLIEELASIERHLFEKNTFTFNPSLKEIEARSKKLEDNRKAEQEKASNDEIDDTITAVLEINQISQDHHAYADELGRILSSKLNLDGNAMFSDFISMLVSNEKQAFSSAIQGLEFFSIPSDPVAINARKVSVASLLRLENLRKFSQEDKFAQIQKYFDFMVRRADLRKSDLSAVNREEDLTSFCMKACDQGAVNALCQHIAIIEHEDALEQKKRDIDALQQAAFHPSTQANALHYILKGGVDKILDCNSGSTTKSISISQTPKSKYASDEGVDRSFMRASNSNRKVSPEIAAVSITPRKIAVNNGIYTVANYFHTQRNAIRTLQDNPTVYELKSDHFDILKKLGKKKLSSRQSDRIKHQFKQLEDCVFNLHRLQEDIYLANEEVNEKLNAQAATYKYDAQFQALTVAYEGYENETKLAQIDMLIAEIQAYPDVLLSSDDIDKNIELFNDKLNQIKILAVANEDEKNESLIDSNNHVDGDFDFEFGEAEETDNKGKGKFESDSESDADIESGNESEITKAIQALNQYEKEINSFKEKLPSKIDEIRISIGIQIQLVNLNELLTITPIVETYPISRAEQDEMHSLDVEIKETRHSLENLRSQHQDVNTIIAKLIQPGNECPESDNIADVLLNKVNSAKDYQSQCKTKLTECNEKIASLNQIIETVNARNHKRSDLIKQCVQLAAQIQLDIASLNTLLADNPLDKNIGPSSKEAFLQVTFAHQELIQTNIGQLASLSQQFTLIQQLLSENNYKDEASIDEQHELIIKLAGNKNAFISQCNQHSFKEKVARANQFVKDKVDCLVKIDSIRQNYATTNDRLFSHSLENKWPHSLFKTEFDDIKTRFLSIKSEFTTAKNDIEGEFQQFKTQLENGLISDLSEVQQQCSSASQQLKKYISEIETLRTEHKVLLLEQRKSREFLDEQFSYLENKLTEFNSTLVASLYPDDGIATWALVTKAIDDKYCRQLTDKLASYEKRCDAARALLTAYEQGQPISHVEFRNHLSWELDACKKIENELLKEQAEFSKLIFELTGVENQHSLSFIEEQKQEGIRLVVLHEAVFSYVKEAESKTYFTGLLNCLSDITRRIDHQTRSDELNNLHQRVDNALRDFDETRDPKIKTCLETIEKASRADNRKEAYEVAECARTGRNNSNVDYSLDPTTITGEVSTKQGWSGYILGGVGIVLGGIVTGIGGFLSATPIAPVGWAFVALGAAIIAGGAVVVKDNYQLNRPKVTEVEFKVKGTTQRVLEIFENDHGETVYSCKKPSERPATALTGKTISTTMPTIPTQVEAQSTVFIPGYGYGV